MLFSTIGKAQVFTETLRINSVQLEQKQKNDETRAKRDYLRNTTTSDTIALPFLDDFSKNDLVWVPSRFYYGLPIYWIGFFSTNNARAFGENGLSLKTFSRGRNWEKLETQVAPSILSASFINNSGTGWSCGKNGWLAKTLDSGQTWSPKNSPSSKPDSPLQQINFQSNSIGLLVDSLGKIFLTIDEGDSWNSTSIAQNRRFKVNSVDWRNASEAVAVGESGKIANSNDGGINWQVTQFVSDSLKRFHKVKIFDSNFGLAVGDSGLVYKTLNGGQSWFKCRSFSANALLDVDISLTNSNICWAVGTNGVLMSSNNKGDSWVQVRSGLNEDLLSLDMVNEFRGFIGSRNGRIMQLFMDPTKPESMLWEKNSGVFINNTFAYKPISMGVATFDGLNANGLPYSNVFNKAGACDTLTSVPLEWTDTTDQNFVSFYFQRARMVVQIIPDQVDSLVLQFKAKSGNWISYWNAKGEITTQPQEFQYRAVAVPDSFAHSGFQFRFINFGIQNGNFDVWNLDYVRMDTQHGPTDSLAADFAMSQLPTRLLKGFSALPLNQFNYYLNNSIPILEDTIFSEVVNLVPGSPQPATAFFSVNSIIPDSSKSLVNIDQSGIIGSTRPLEPGFSRRTIGIPTSSFSNKLQNLNQYTTLQYGFGINKNEFNVYQSNDTLYNTLNLSTYVAYDDGSAELIRGVGGNLAKGAVKFYIPETDTLTDIALNFPRTPFNFEQTTSFTLILYDSINIETNFERPIFRLPVILPPADSVNKFDYFSLRLRPISQRIIKGGQSFFIGWQQGLIDNGNEVKLGCDINSSNPGMFYYNSQGKWLIWAFDNFPMMIRPVFGVENPVSIKEIVSSPRNPFFPNPSTGSIQNKEAFYKLQIFNQLGQTIFEKNHGEAFQSIEIDLQPGLYVARWQDQSSIYQSQRLVIE